MRGKIKDASDGSEDAQMAFKIMTAGSLTDRIILEGGQPMELEGGAVFNEGSADVDFRVESNGNANMFKVDGGDNKIYIGHDADQAYDAGFTPAVQIAQVGNTVYGGIGMAHYSNDAEGAVLIMGSGRATSVTGTTIVADGDTLGRIEFQGQDGGDFETGASIFGEVDGTPGANDMPGRLVFKTTADGAHSATEKMRISNAGKTTHTHSGDEDGIIYTNTNESNTGSHIKLESYRSATSDYWFMQGVSDSNGSPDREFRIDGVGAFFSDAASYSTGAGDYAEYFEWKDGNSSSEDRRGYPVVLDSDNKIRKATSDDAKANIIGIVSANPAVVGDNPDSWKGKYMRDDYNGIVTEEYTLTQWEVDVKNEQGDTVKETKSYHTDRIPEGVSAPSDAVVKTKDDDGNTFIRRKMNPNYDTSKTWVSREDRKEWDAIGLMGKLFLRKGQPTGDRWIKMRDISDNVEEWLVR